MKSNILILTATALTIVTLSTEGLAQRQSAPPSSQTRQQPLAQIVETRGMVQLKRDNNYQVARVGDDLFIGNLVRVPKGSRLVIRCTTNSRNWTIPDDNLPRGVANVCSPPM